MTNKSRKRNRKTRKIERSERYYWEEREIKMRR